MKAHFTPDPRVLSTATEEQRAAWEKIKADDEAMVEAMITDLDTMLTGGTVHTPTRRASKFELAADVEIERDWLVQLASFKGMTKKALRQYIIDNGGRVSGNFQPIRSDSSHEDYLRHALDTWAGTIYTKHTGVKHEYVPISGRL